MSLGDSIHGNKTLMPVSEYDPRITMTAFPDKTAMALIVKTEMPDNFHVIAVPAEKQDEGIYSFEVQEPMGLRDVAIIYDENTDLYWYRDGDGKHSVPRVGTHGIRLLSQLFHTKRIDANNNRLTSKLTH